MKLRGILLMGLSLLLGFIAIGWIQQSGGKGGGGATTDVVVAVSPIDFAKHVELVDVRTVKWPADAVPPGAFTKIDDVVSTTTDRVALRTIEPGEPILASMLTGSGGKASLSTVIDLGMRAVAIHVTDATGVAGFVSPGDRVDVLLTRGVQERENPETDILLQNVKVLGIDQESSERKETPTLAKVVTLEVSPEDGQKLTLGGQVGTLSLALRNYTNPAPVASRTLSLADLRTDPVTPAPAANQAPAAKPTEQEPPKRRVARAEPLTMGIIRGTVLTNYEVERSGAVSATANTAAPK